jgi:RNA-directed DNA polymerase
LGIERQKLLSLAKAANRLYSCRDEPKKSGGVRVIEAPFPPLKAAQSKLRVTVLDNIPVHSDLHGVRGTSQITAAAVHRSQAVVITMDIKDFFPSVTSTMVKEALASHSVDSSVADVICRLTTRKKRLPQGAPTSPVLARIVITPAVERLRGLLASISPACKISVYVDDISLSGPMGLQRAIPTVTKILREHGFEFSEKKTKIRKGDEDKEVLGLRVSCRLEPGAAFRKKLEVARQSLPSTSPKLKGLESWVQTVSRANRNS